MCGHGAARSWLAGRKALTSRVALGRFAAEIGLPTIASSWSRTNQKLPVQEPSVWREMIEAVIGVLFFEFDCNFSRLSEWLVSRYFEVAKEEDEWGGYVSPEDYLDMIGVDSSLGYVSGDD